METFFYITQKLISINDNNIIYSINEKNKKNDVYDFWDKVYEGGNICKNNNIVNLLFYNYITSYYSEYTTQNKFERLYHILENRFYNDKLKNDFLDLFCKIQNIYHKFSKLAFIYKNKKTKIIVNYDLFMNDLYENTYNVITIIQNNNKYLFNITDIIKIIKNAICNTSYFFPSPICCKNPYNNIPFNKSTLYNIYFFIKSKNYVMPQIIHNYFLANFDLSEFKINNEYIIREYAIKNYITSTPYNILHNNVNELINFYNRYCYIKKLNKKIHIHYDFPEKELVEIFRPYLHMYYIYKFTNLESRKIDIKILLIKKLLDFYNYNPLFGRRKLRINRGFQKDVIHVEFNIIHIPFYGKDINFIESHLKITEVNYNIDPYTDYDYELRYNYSRTRYVNNNEDVSETETDDASIENTADENDETEVESNNNDNIETAIQNVFDNEDHDELSLDSDGL